MGELIGFLVEMGIELVALGFSHNASDVTKPDPAYKSTRERVAADRARIASDGPLPGEVVALCRGTMRRFGLYVGAGQVIHGEPGPDGHRIARVPLRQFLRDAMDYEVLILPPGGDAVAQAEAQLGKDHWPHGDNFGLWCRTGIANPAEAERFVNALRQAGAVQICSKV